MQPSRQLLYFLLGLIIPFLALRLAYSDTLPMSATCGVNTFYKISYYATQSAAQQARDSYGAAGGYYVGANDQGDPPCGGPGNYAYVVWETRGPDYYGRAFVYYDGYTGDTDNDGLPDECDVYPNDSTPYSLKQISVQTSDNTWEGDPIRICYQTDRGDITCTGSYNPGYKVFFNSDNQWIQGSDICKSTGGSEPKSGPEDGEGPYPGTPVTGPSDGQPDFTDPTLEPGTKSTGNETGDAALRGILNNTGVIANNTQRIGDYAMSLNAAVKNMENYMTLAHEREEKRELERKQAESEAAYEKQKFEEFDIETVLSGNINADITEGPSGDYQEHGPLSEESWVTEFIDTNPISTVLGQSGFQYSNASCTADLNLGYLGQHSINICHLEGGFIAFGQLLVALVTLTGLVHVVTGRGF